MSNSSTRRESGKPWKLDKKATKRSQMSQGLRSPWRTRILLAAREDAVRKVQAELSHHKQLEADKRKEAALKRKQIAREHLQVQESKTKVNAKKAARMQKRRGHSKKVNH